MNQSDEPPVPGNDVTTKSGSVAKVTDSTGSSMSDSKTPSAPDVKQFSIRGFRPELSDLLLGAVFVVFLIQQSDPFSGKTNGILFLLVYMGWMQLRGMMAWLRPPLIEFQGDQVRLRLFHWERTLETSRSNLAALGNDDDRFVIRFHDLTKVENLSKSRKLNCEAAFKQTGFHMVLPSTPFHFRQTNQLRVALGASPMNLPVQQTEKDLESFAERIRQRTKRPIVTYVLMMCCVFVFAMMQVEELALWSPSGGILLAWGANFGLLTLSEQWWRLVTYQFVHIGLLHLVMNMSVLKKIGPTVERLIGSEMLLIGYLSSGIGGGLASLFWNPLALSAGASGSIFGLFGLILGLLTRHHKSLPIVIVKQFRGVITMFVLLNIFFGFAIPGIDVAAHLGGLVAGFVFGLMIFPVTELASTRSRILQFVLVTTIWTAAAVLGYRQIVSLFDVDALSRPQMMDEADNENEWNEE